MTGTVLVPVDGSPRSFDALRHALTTFPAASITVLHVVDLFGPGYGERPDAEGSCEPLIGSEEWYDRAEGVSGRPFAEARTVADDRGREVVAASEIGDPERVVVDYADEEGADHVVLGAHGRREADRPLFGIVVETVARRAPVPVTIVRRPPPAAPGGSIDPRNRTPGRPEVGDGGSGTGRDGRRPATTGRDGRDADAD